MKSSFELINSEARGHYLVNYKGSAIRKQIIKLIEAGKIETIDRLMLLTTSSMLARAGVDNFGETLNMLSAYEHEQAESVWDIIALVIADSRKFVDADEKLEADIKKLVGQLIASEYKRLGWEEKPNESVADQKLRATVLGLGAYAEVDAIVKEALALFEQYKKDSSSVNAELRGISFAVAVKNNVSGAADYLLGLHKSTNSSDLDRKSTR